MSLPVPSELVGLCESVFGERMKLAETYADLLANEGIEWGLIGPRERDRIWERHIVNSLCVVPLISRGRRVTDIGSGAGLPGVVLGIARPDLKIDLVEPMQRRCDFLEMTVDILELTHVRVVRARAEEYQGHPNVVTCRAVSSVLGLVPMIAPLLKRAELLAIKGERAEEEVQKAKMELVAYRLWAEVLKPSVCGETVGTVVRITSRK